MAAWRPKPELLKNFTGYFYRPTRRRYGAQSAPAEAETVSETSPPSIGNEAASQSPVSPEKMEAVLKPGLVFIGGLLEMATGQKLEPLASDGRMLHDDPASGEVTLKFKLPGFGSNIRG